jgi:hypothetical protein
MDFKTALTKFVTDFVEGAMAGAIFAFETADPSALLSARTLAFVVTIGAFDGAISAARRYVKAAFDSRKP